MYKIFWQPKAVRQLEKIRNIKLKTDIFAMVDMLQDYQSCLGIKPLKNHKYDFRLRVGQYRVLFSVNDIVQVIDIHEVKKHYERTY
jgi:mRNA interferase RelE/StbE